MRYCGVMNPIVGDFEQFVVSVMSRISMHLPQAISARDLLCTYSIHARPTLNLYRTFFDCTSMLNVVNRHSLLVDFAVLI